jgi:hypothetical protein
MAKQFAAIEPAHAAMIAEQKIFFTASAAAGARVNLTPRSTSAFRVLGPNQVAYLDLTGSGNETAAHLRADGRLTIMLCAFEGPPSIVRLYGRGSVLPHGSERYFAVLAQAFDNEDLPGARQIILLDVEMLQTSCGWAVPVFDYREERQTLNRWIEAKEKIPGALDQYRREKNARSIDGLPSGMFADEA